MQKRLVPAVASFLAMLSLIVSSEAAGAPTTAPTIQQPQIPSRVFNIVDYGAKGTGTTLDTDAIKKAIDACDKSGGGTVRIPAGQFLTAPFSLTSNLNLHLDEGAALRISNNPADFRLARNRYQDCIDARDCHDIAITGKGTIDGQGRPWWVKFNATKNAPPEAPIPPHRPFLITLTECQRILVQDVTLTNSPMFHLFPQECQDVTIERVHFLAPANSPNTDALDLSGRNFLITKCLFDVGDDCIAIKATHQIDPSRPSCENILIADCTFLHGHGLSIGGQTTGGLRHMRVRDCTFDGTNAGIRMKAGRGSGGLVEDVSYENLTMKNVNVAILITSYYPQIPEHPAQDSEKKVTKTTPIWRNIRISNVKSDAGQTAGRILGLPEMPVSDVVLTNVTIDAQKGMEISNARGIVFEHSQITAQSGPPMMTVAKSQVSGIDFLTGK
jgi:polygalacturonase